MRLLVIGGSVSGLTLSLIAGAAGHDVVVVERDASEPPTSAEMAWSTWNRRVPQFRQIHGYQGLARELLAEHAPYVLTALLKAGARIMEIAGTSGDDPAVVQFGCRRATLEWTLRRLALDAARVRFLPGVTVRGFVRGADGRDSVPSIVGVVTDVAGRIESDVVVDASGRRSSLPTWLEAAGCQRPSEDSVPANQVYFTRWYRCQDRREVHRRPLRVDLDFAACMASPADSGWFSVTFFAPSGDVALRRALSDPAQFQRAALTIPGLEQWIEPSRSHPESEVLFMGNLANQHRSLQHGSGLVASGIVAVGDAAVTTNPTWGRGVGLALRHVVELVALLGKLSEPDEVCVAFAEFTREVIRPWYDDTVALDQDVNEYWAAGTGDKQEVRSSRLPIGHHRLVAAAREDDTIFHKYVRYRNLRFSPRRFWQDDAMIERVAQLGAEPPRPSKQQLLVAASS